MDLPTEWLTWMASTKIDHIRINQFKSIYFCLRITWDEGVHGRKTLFGIIKRKMWSKCYCRTSKRKQFTTIKCKVQDNRKIEETQTSVTSTTEAEQERQFIYPRWIFNKNYPLCWFYKPWISFQNTNTRCVQNNHLYIRYWCVIF